MVDEQVLYRPGSRYFEIITTVVGTFHFRSYGVKAKFSLQFVFQVGEFYLFVVGKKHDVQLLSAGLYLSVDVPG
ncbi:hypothetical protein D3C87_1311870 [compost metagenome]